MIHSMVPRADIQVFVDQVVERFRPTKVILFGSQARGDATEDSDVDLMVVMRHRGSSMAKAAEIRIACPRSFPMDLLVRSPADFRKSVRSETFMRDIAAQGIVLHEGNHARMDRKSRS